jgi:glycosyltransferase involved in cell wall biosynthesis
VKILLIHQYYLEEDDPGGSRFNEMTRIWSQAGHEVTVICGMLNYLTGKVPAKYAGKKYHQSFYGPGLNVLRCYVSPQYNVSFLGRLWAYFSFVWFSLLGIFFKLKDQKFDVIVATSPPLFIGLVAWVASRLKRIPYVFEVRDLWPESAIDTGVLTNRHIIRFSFWLEKVSYRGAFMINVLTPAFRERLIADKKVPADKIIFIPNACDFSLSDSLLDKFDSQTFREKLGWKNKFVITYVGVHGIANHLIQLIQVAEMLKNTNIHIVLIGDGPQKVVLKQEAIKRDLRNVEFIDSMPKVDVMKYLLASDAGISVLKKNDTFKTIYSNKTFDYMACKKPIVMVIDGVSRQLVEDAKCGVYTEPEDVEMIAEKMSNLSGDASLCKRMGESGYQYAKIHFDRLKLADQYVFEIQNRLERV